MPHMHTNEEYVPGGRSVQVTCAYHAKTIKLNSAWKPRRTTPGVINVEQLASDLSDCIAPALPHTQKPRARKVIRRTRHQTWIREKLATTWVAEGNQDYTKLVKGTCYFYKKRDEICQTSSLFLGERKWVERGDITVFWPDEYFCRIFLLCQRLVPVVHESSN